MGLSEDEIEARLAALRRQREALDREIADLALYLELGRRLSSTGMIPDPPHRPASPETRERPVPAPPEREQPAFPARVAARVAARIVPRAAAPTAPRTEPRSPSCSETGDPPGAIPPPVAFTEDAAGARRYGRAVVQAACAAIAQAGRPLHAAEILEILLQQGFTLPGRDPVAALNTRLWKRTGPGGPLRRLGEATYALVVSDPPAA